MESDGRRFQPVRAHQPNWTPTDGRESRKERNSPVPVDEFPTDVSVYGVRGLGGNIQGWTATEEVSGTGPARRVARVGRGGCWSSAARDCRAAFRLWVVPAVVLDVLGFRLARSL